MSVDDPIDLTVSETWTKRSWTPAGSFLGDNDWYWLIHSGWGLSKSGKNSNSSYSDTSGVFTNFIFCNPMVETKTFHNITRISTNTNGGYAYYHDVIKDGDCAFWLHTVVSYS